MLDRYFTLEDPPAGARAPGDVGPGGARVGPAVRGFIDRLDVAATGEIRVVDYKTGSAPREEFEARALFQMKFYALVLWRTGGVVPKLLQLIYLGNGEIVRYAPDEADLLATERKVNALWRAIERARQAATGAPGRAGCVTGARTRRYARRSAAPRRPSPRTCPWRRCPSPLTGRPRSDRCWGRPACSPR